MRSWRAQRIEDTSILNINSATPTITDDASKQKEWEEEEDNGGGETDNGQGQMEKITWKKYPWPRNQSK